MLTIRNELFRGFLGFVGVLVWGFRVVLFVVIGLLFGFFVLFLI